MVKCSHGRRVAIDAIGSPSNVEQLASVIRLQMLSS
jgi:hypothetical protein